MGWGTLADDAQVESDTGLKTQAQPLAKNANLSTSSRLLTCRSGGGKWTCLVTTQPQPRSSISRHRHPAQAKLRKQDAVANIGATDSPKRGAAEAASHPRLSGNGLIAKNAWVPDTAARFRDEQRSGTAQRLAM